MFVGDFIKCVNVGNCKESLTNGKYYEILEIGKEYEEGLSFYIETDRGDLLNFVTEHNGIIYFDISSIRNKIIDDILL